MTQPNPTQCTSHCAATASLFVHQCAHVSDKKTKCAWKLVFGWAFMFLLVEPTESAVVRVRRFCAV